MKGELSELMDFKKQLDLLTVRSKIPFVNVYRRHKKKKIINETGFDYCKAFLSGMNYITARNVCNMYNNLNDQSYRYNSPFYDEEYDRDLRMSDLRVIMGDYYVEMHISIVVEHIPLIRRAPDKITKIKYVFVFQRSGEIYIQKESTVVDEYGKERNVIVDGSYEKGDIMAGHYEYFIIKNTFYKALTYYIFNLLNK